MNMISDQVSMKLYRHPAVYGQLARLRMGPDYGHGFQGLFNALFNGDLEDVINDPGPPFLSKEDAEKYANFLINVCEDCGIKIPKKSYKYKTSNLKFYENCSKDCLFE